MSFHFCWCRLLNKLRNVTGRICFKLTGVDIISIFNPFKRKRKEGGGKEKGKNTLPKGFWILSNENQICICALPVFGGRAGVTMYDVQLPREADLGLRSA